ncbi:ABC transporter permease [Jatrophihabitans fulvus]
MSATTVTDRPVRPAPQLPPTARIPYGRLLRVEWRKATDTRAARWLIGLTALATAALMLAPLLARNSIDQTYSSYLLFAGFGLATLLPVVSILTLTSEWTQRTVLTTFTQEPRRVRVVSAKIVVALLMALGAIVYGAIVTAVALVIASAGGRDLTNDLGAANTIGYALFVLANIAMGVALGALLHNSAAAIVLFFVLPAALGFLGAALKAVGEWIDPGTTFNWLLEGDLGGHVPNILVSAVLWIAIPLTAGLVRTVRREIN